MFAARLAMLSAQVARRSSDESVAASAPNLRMELSEDAIALEFKQKVKGQLRWCVDHGEWFKWNGSVWQLDRKKEAFNAARVFSRDLVEHLENRWRLKAGKASFVNAIERFARADPDLIVTAEAWDRDPFLLGTPAGTIELRTGQLRNATPADGITKAVAIVPAQRAHCPLWLRFLNEATGNDTALVRFMQQWAGYVLTGDTREHALVFMFGDGGNGKSVFLQVLTGIMADYATVASMDTFVASHGDRHSTDLAMLRGARLVTASETEEGRHWAEARIKALTGGDAISARFMRQDFFTFKPTFKLTVVGNHKPGLKSVDGAARRRFNLVPFTRKPAIVDPELADKLNAEWPAILRWMIDGCLDWQANGLVRPDSIREATEAYFDEQDVIAEWLLERCRVEPNNGLIKASTHSLFASWTGFARERQEEAGSMRAFIQRLRQLGLQMLKNVPTQDGNRSRGFSGITLVIAEEKVRGQVRH